MYQEVEKLSNFTRTFFQKIGCSSDDAEIISDVFISAELRGIGSHGLIRIPDYYNLWKAGRINPIPNIRITHESPSTAVVDGDRAVGMVAGNHCMKKAISLAEKSGTGWVACSNSNHFGIAGYYSMMALKHDMIGISLTNANPLVAPTFSISRMLGTNPIAVAIPAGKYPPFVADFATTPIARGKLEVLVKKGEDTLPGYVQDSEGKPSTDPDILRKGGAMVPLGGDRDHGSHKGYCLGSIVDIFSALLSGAGFGPFVPPSVAYLPVPDESNGRGTGHFFGAMRIDAFQKPEQFKERMEKWIDTFRSAKSADDNHRVLIPGDIERDNEEVNLRRGIYLMPKILEELNKISQELTMEIEL